MDYASHEDLRRVAGEIGAETGCRLIVLHGSTARQMVESAGSEREPEDVDLAVLPGSEADSVDFVGLTNAFIRRLGLQYVDLTDLRHADPLTMMAVAREGVPLFEDPPGEFGRFHSLAVRRYADTRKFRDLERAELREFVEESGATP